MLNSFRDSITHPILLIQNGFPYITGWADQELVNNKSGWEALWIVSTTLLSGTYIDHIVNEYPIPQTMVGVEIEIDSDEFQAWYQSFTKIPAACNFRSSTQDQ